MKFILALCISLFFISPVSSRAERDVFPVVIVKSSPSTPIRWRVGEFQEFDVFSKYGNMGKMMKKVVSEQGNAIWVHIHFSGMISHKIEMLIDRTSGAVLEYWENGQKADDPNANLEIISENPAQVTVPAGTFDTLHTIAKTRKSKKVELWANSRMIPMDGAAQQIVDVGILTLTMKLSRYGDH